MWTRTKRIIHAGFINFWRNGTVTLSSVLVMIIALFFIGSVVFVGVLLTSALDQVRDKVDVRVYFVTSAPETTILALQKKVEALPEVEHVDYTSADQVLQNFKDKHGNDQLVLQALSEVEGNPLGATLNIRTKELSQYQSVVDYVKQQSGTTNSLVDSIDAEQNSAKKLAIERLTAIISSVQTLGFVVTIILVIVAILIIFNTIRLVIYMSREEISVMKLVGASNMYIRGPFFVTGVMYGLIAGIVVMALFYPITYALIPFSTVFGIVNLFGYYVTNFAIIALLVVGSGVLIGGISSFLAVRRYLKV